MANLEALIEQCANQAARNSALCPSCGELHPFLNHVGERPLDCQRCHQNGRRFEHGCRAKNCPRERPIESGWREKGWP